MEGLIRIDMDHAVRRAIGRGRLGAAEGETLG
jgi:hypothetical protein